MIEDHSTQCFYHYKGFKNVKILKPLTLNDAYLIFLVRFAIKIVVIHLKPIIQNAEVPAVPLSKVVLFKPRNEFNHSISNTRGP